jgi:hypothetical protein
MAFPLPPTTTDTSSAYIANMTTLASRAFATDGFPAMVLRERHNLTTVTRADLARHYAERINSKIRADAVIIEAGNWAAAAFSEPPKPPSDSALDSPETAVAKADNEVLKAEAANLPRSPVLEDFNAHSKLAKHTHLGPSSYYYLSLMARDSQDPGRTTKGAVRAVLEPFIARARSEGLPIWLEAGTERARDVYVYFGFKVVDMFVSGRGQYDRQGAPVKGGTGCLMTELAILAERRACRRG